jgi:TetR/AcrR family transcriptional repressor of nem operon
MLAAMIKLDTNSAKPGARVGLLDAALASFREKGYAATSVDELCARAGVTKGAFFHHFKSKEALAVAAARHWTESTSAFFDAAPYRAIEDPYERLLGYLEFRKAILQGPLAGFTCFAGTLAQEVYESHPAIRAAVEESICGHAATLEPDIAAAIRSRGLQVDWTPASLALHTQAVLQGAFVLAKATGDAAVAAASVDHLRRYIELLFHRPTP